MRTGYCCDVAPMTPVLTWFTPSQPPSIEEMIALEMPACFRAPFAPTAVGSLRV